MEVISYVIVILLSLVGYAIGAVGKAGKSVELKPQIIDLLLILFIWAAAISSKIILDPNRWLLVLVFIIISSLTGMLAVWPRKLSRQETASYEAPKHVPENTFKRLWQRWKDFSIILGAFQTRMIFSLCFFILVSPVALAVKTMHDPLSLKFRKNESYWLPKSKTTPSLGQFRKQF